MRSPYLSNFRSQLAELNNRLSHYIFVWEQFLSDNNEILSKQKNKQTTAVYTDNRFAAQYDVKLQLLESSHEATANFILKSLFVLLYTEFEVYMRELYEFARKINKDLPNLDVKARVPDKIFELLGIDMEVVLEQKEIWTLDYFRLRRNRIVHNGGQSKGDLASAIKNRGNALQRYWTGRLKRGLFGLNFQSEETNDFTKEEIFDYINIWRILTKKIDQLITGHISKEAIIKDQYNAFKSERKDKWKRWGEEKTKRKFVGFVTDSFGFRPEMSELDKFDFKVS